MSRPVVIRVSGVRKNFVLPHLRRGTIKSSILQPFKGKAKKKQETQEVLRGIDLEIYKGEFFGIVGRNGSGKSTLLKLLAGIYQPTKGKIDIMGRLVPFIELGVGFNPELTGRENVYLNAAILGFSEAQVNEMYDEIVNFSELERFMDQKLKNYSSGMQVRLAFSMAIRAQADILLVDEVLAVGDADFQRKCFDYFKSLKASGSTVVFISHDMEAVKSFCDRAVLLENGKIIVQGKSRDVAREYMKLFNKEQYEAEESAQSKKKNRWGSGAVKIESVKISRDSDQPYSPIKLNVIAKATKPVENPVFGFSVRDTADRELFGTNTELSNKPVDKLEAGEEIEFNWELPDVFGDGEFFVSTTAHHRAGSPVYDWWEESAIIKISEGRHSYFVLTPDFKVQHTKRIRK